MSQMTYAVQTEHRLRESAYRRALGDPEQDWLARDQWRAPMVDLAGVGHALRAVMVALIGGALR